MSNIKVGFGRTDITPPMGLYIAGYYAERRGDGVLDPLEANCVAFSDGEKTAVVISIDLIGMPQTWADKLRNTISGITGLPYEAVYICCTHTHTAPTVSGSMYPRDEEYLSVSFRKIGDAAKCAVDDMTDASFFTARGEVEGISFIRRYKMKDGTTRTNPGYMNPDIDHAIGTSDDSLQLVRIVREGKDDVVIINFQCHPDVIGGNKYSSDWPGRTRRAFEGAVPGTKCIFFNGAQGDTNHYCLTPEYHTEKSYRHSMHMGLSVAGEAMKLYTYAEPIECNGVDYKQYNYEVPSNRGTPEQLPLAEKYIALHEAGKRSEIPYTGMEYTTVVAEAYRIKQLENGPDSYTLYLNAVKVGSIAFSGIPGEPFTDIGRGIKDGSPFDMTIVCCCANGDEAYYPMQSAYDEGGYEARSSTFAAGIAERIIDGSVEMLKKIHG